MTETSGTKSIDSTPENPRAWIRYGVWIAVIAQLATILITWPTWSARTSPPNLPLIPFPEISVGWLVLVSLVAPLLLPRRGAWIHLAVLVVCGLGDQFRIQPQFYFGWLFIWYTSTLRADTVGHQADDSGTAEGPTWVEEVCRWTLVALWIWTGTHKLLSPEWLGPRSYNFLSQMGLSDPGPSDPALQLYFGFAVLIGCSEVLLGLCAILKPRVAALGCVLLHLGIVISLLLANWNFSVLAWNLMCALCGYFILRRFAGPAIRGSKLQIRVAIALLIVVPSLFYVGWVDRAFSFVLYSGMTPTGTITHLDIDESTGEPVVEKVRGWNQEGRAALAVPFPAEHRCYREYFERTSKPGSKLSIIDPRMWVDDEYFVRTDRGSDRITKSEFFAKNPGTVRGVVGDSALSAFRFNLAKIRRLVRSERSMIYAIEFTPDDYSPDLLPLLAGFPNVEQINFSGCPVKDEDLRHLAGLVRLEGVGLADTQVGPEGLRHLEELPELRIVLFEGSKLSQEDVDRFLE